MNLIKNNTPIEIHKVNGVDIYVKREDLCSTYPAPPFSKIRGLFRHLQKLKTQGIKTVGYVETPISMAGWGIAWGAKELGMKSVIYEPQYVEQKKGYNKSLNVMKKHKRMWEYFGATILPIPAGRTTVNNYIAQKDFYNKFGKESLLLPIGISLKETIEETDMEYCRTIDTHGYFDNIVIAVGSGTICAGIFGRVAREKKGKVIGILCRNGSILKKSINIHKKAGIPYEGGFLQNSRLKLIDPGWEYTQKCEIKQPFPCHPYYDLKAWDWLVKNIDNLSGKILFWNIGNSNVNAI